MFNLSLRESVLPLMWVALKPHRTPDYTGRSRAPRGQALRKNPSNKHPRSDHKLQSAPPASSLETPSNLPSSWVAEQVDPCLSVLLKAEQEPNCVSASHSGREGGARLHGELAVTFQTCHQVDNEKGERCAEQHHSAGQ